MAIHPRSGTGVHRVVNRAASALTIVLLSACGTPTKTPPATPPVPPPPPPPGYSVRAIADSALKSMSWQFAQMPWMLNEAHDGQALATGQAYGPAMYAYSSPYLGGFTNDGSFSDQGPAGVLVSVVFVGPWSSTTLPQNYQDLHLSPGLNCVHAALAGGNWTGYISAATINAQNKLPECPRIYTQSVATQLPILRQPKLTNYNSHTDYPPVTRISEWDADRYAIGFRCAKAWCEIGPPGFQARPPVDDNDLSRPHTKERDIKGWHDEQRLAVISGGTPVPTDLVAKAEPVPNLAELDSTSFDKTAWTQVGVVWLAKDPDQINHKKYFDAGFRKGLNKVLARFTTTNLWQTMIRDRNGTETTLKKTTRTIHYDIAGPGTMRWYWNEKDEGMWYRCGGACCEVEL